MKLKAFLFSIALTVLALPASAADGTWTNVTVTAVQPCTPAYCGGTGVVLVQFSTNSSGGPSCAAGLYNWTAIDTTSAAGAFAASVLESARLLGSTIPSVSGAGSCAVRSGYETLGWVLQ